MACATAKKDGSSRYASSIRARSTRLAGSVRERAIAPNFAKSFSPIANSIACRHAVMSSTLSANQSRKPRTHVGKCESSTYDGFHGIDVLAAEQPLGRGDFVCGTLVDGNCQPQSPRQTLEAGFRDVVVVGAVERLDMQGDAGIRRERLKPLLHQLGIER